ncbi:MAG: Tol-Pal system beta propeller repeat protein TolB [candidate division Zixibacteria bacterium]|nr:Tol-Pal system beta propeller repeat protein TolB [candidate division Zixibacteria bacterium]
MKWKLYTVIFGIILCAQSGFSQNTEIRNIFFDTIRAGDVQVTPIGVDDSRYIGASIINSDDSTLMRYIADVIRRDIDFYSDFALVPIDSFYLKTYEIEELDLLGWMRLGAKYLVRLEVEFPGPNMRIYWRLSDVMSKAQIAKGQVEDNRTFWRELAHDISNEIARTLTGDAGIFRTQIVYVRKIRNGKELFVSDYDGANERQLTKNGSINLSPSFAPNLEDVYFTSFMDGNPHLYRVNIQSGKTTKIASYPGINAAPSVSPDGNKIACVLSKDGNSEIYLLDTSGKIIQRLTNNAAIESAPSWSPDGRMIAFTSDRTGTPQIYVMDSDGFNVKRLTYEGGYNDSPLWSLRGQRVTFVSRTKQGRFDLASINTDGTDYRVLTQLGMNENPHFAPDGKHIVFTSSRLSGSDIYSMDLTGRNQRRVTRSGDASNPTWGPIR